MTDPLHSFLFEQHNVRGLHVRLDTSYARVLAAHGYPSLIGQLLGQAMATAALLGSSIKFEGRVALQARGTGAVSLLLAEATHAHTLRAVAHYEMTRLESSAATLAGMLGAAHLALTLIPDDGEQYQGIVPMEGAALAECLEDYFSRSEQLPTRLWLAADDHHASGLLLQQLPPASAAQATREDAEYWQHLTVLADTVKDVELLSLSCEQLLHRLYHEEEVRLFAPTQWSFACRCSVERSEFALQTLGQAEVESILAEKGQVDIDCEFCRAHYRFGPDEARALFEPPALH